MKRLTELLLFLSFVLFGCDNLVTVGVQLVVLLALNDDGAPAYNHGNAQFLSNLGVPVFACTPDKFPDLMAATLSKQDIS
ncbi:MAG: hypothetical protein J7502_20130, partial [Flavisolibacter sp.]|nr:hypothetical protein [Flavisolibacter sp.]